MTWWPLHACMLDPAGAARDLKADGDQKVPVTNYGNRVAFVHGCCRECWNRSSRAGVEPSGKSRAHSRGSPMSSACRPRCS